MSRVGRRTMGISSIAAVLMLTVHARAADAQAVGTRSGDELEDGARDFWLAPAPDVRDHAAERLLSVEASFEIWYAALHRAPDYSPDVPVGRLDLSRVGSDGRTYPYTVLVPEAYDPGRSYPVVVYLHGGVNRPAWQVPGQWWRDYGRITDPQRIIVVPAGWREATWWQASQTENLAGILAELRRTYHVDPDRVHLVGISDGGTGAYYQAFRDPTAWASFLPFIGHPAVLSSPRLRVEGQMYATNLRNRPLMIINGGKDRLYPTASVEPFVKMFRENGVKIVYRPQPEAGHDLTWWPAEAVRIDSFLVASRRVALPDALDWETEDLVRGRISWLVIDELGSVRGESDLLDRNTIQLPGQSEPVLAFPHRRVSGRVEVRRSGNRVSVRTRGVRRFRLLVSPEMFDLARPIRVEVNGAVRFDKIVEPSRETLLAWAALDGDRSMLFAAEIEIAS